MKVFLCIVTYNRAALLQRLLAHIQAQTLPPDTCCIIDNASTDETSLVGLNAEKLGYNYIRTNNNLGGAGGFSLATRLFQASPEHDLLLLMDDDAAPSPEMIEKLVNAIETQGLDIANALVIDEEDRQRLSFGLDLHFADRRSVKIQKVHEAVPYIKDNIIRSTYNPFNGTMYKREVIERAGYIDARMFIWGDEAEYTHRVGKLGIRTGTVSDAILLHPTDKNTQKMLPFVGKVTIPPKKRAHYWFRNRGRLATLNGITIGLLPRIIKIILLYIQQGDFLLGLKLAFYYCDGALNLYRLPPTGGFLTRCVEHEAMLAIQKLKSPQ